jgi:hypothetical protein
VVVPCLSPTLQLLRIAVKDTEESKIRKRPSTKKMMSKPRVRRKTLTSKSRIEGPPWIRSTSVSALWIETPWSRNSCHSTCSAWASLKWTGGASARRSPYSGCTTPTSGAGGAA